MRVQREVNEEPNSTRVYPNESEEVSESLDGTQREPSDLLVGDSDRLRTEQVLDDQSRHCILCYDFIEREDFLNHIRTVHKTDRSTKTDAGFVVDIRAICGGWCKWLCSVCGQTHYYQSTGNKHGGPVRLLDRRYGLAQCRGSRYGDGHKRAFGRIDGQAGPVIFYHEGAPNPEQPEQDDPSLAPFVTGDKRESSVRKKANPKKSSARVSRVAG